MTIRTKLLLGALFFTMAVVGAGAYAIYGVNRISALMTQTYDGALMASIHAEQAHTNFIKVDRALRNALASRTVDEFDRQLAAGEQAAVDVLSDLDVVAERTWNAESAHLVNEIKALVGEQQTRRAAALPSVRQQLAGASRLGGEPVTATPAAGATDATPPAAARASSAAVQAPAEDSGVQIVKRKAADGTVTSAPPQTVPRVPQVGAATRSASLAPAMPRVPQVVGSTSPAVGVDVSAQPPVAAPAPPPAVATLAASLFEGSERIEAKLRALADRATEAGFVFRESSRRISRTIMNATIGALVAVIVIGVATVLLFGRWIANPLRQVIQRLHNLVVGEGTLEQRLAATKELPVQSADEIGQLRASLNATVTLLRQREAEVRQREAQAQRDLRHDQELQEHIGNFLKVAHQIAQGDLTQRGAVTDDKLGRVVDSINEAVDKLGSTVRDVQEASERVFANARDMIVSSEQLAAGAQEQSREAINAANALDAVTKSVRQVADNATASAMAARRALEAAQEGDLAVRHGLEGMEGIRVEIEENTQKLKRLVDRSMEISEVVKTVQNLASQTDLLALNAAIEAAGAGEAGTRFAAVAAQIRRLADLAAQAAKDVGTLVHAVQLEMQAAREAMEQGTHRMEEGYQVSRRASERLQEIATISRESAALAQEISVATQDQVRGTEGVATAVQVIAGFAVQTDHGAVHARKTVESLAGLAEELRVKLSQFKVGA